MCPVQGAPPAPFDLITRLFLADDKARVISIDAGDARIGGYYLNFSN